MDLKIETNAVVLVGWFRTDIIAGWNDFEKSPWRGTSVRKAAVVEFEQFLF